jgi:hypothetical protein
VARTLAADENKVWVPRSLRFFRKGRVHGSIPAVWLFTNFTGEGSRQQTEMQRSFVGKPSLCEGLRFLKDDSVPLCRELGHPLTSLSYNRCDIESKSVIGETVADEITVSAPNERVDLEALKATKARRKGAER